ncbi:PaaX family transcriptional regulator C-terminal domain-containing protein [Streptomyces sp. NBC_00878]|uniref:PaaX family transcriptional regulator C-terminal domain-containing protein n=1 Tax=Streptomyces sp. NBC_00878 TaxID=2975854 RepID=UPI00224F1C3A|nr:PaaX family transcriptional regulator C-terminal domain-containing protein [Streptomyces sp. NBC_00878]MCX4902992.1 PaaX domain-containing protein, C- domain protein [Streptomyces sp. NBC_00878]
MRSTRTNASQSPTDIEPRPLSARSVVLSLLLGVHPPELPVRDLVRSVEPFGIADSTLRAALSRMVAGGDLHRADGVYRLSERLLERQRRQDDAVHPRTRAWDGSWETVVVTATGRGPAERAELRAELSRLRLAELREGVWLRPANLRRSWPAHLTELTQRFTARPEQPARALAASLWPLDDWADTAGALLARVARLERPADRFATFTAIVRHLVTDPVLPDELLPTPWPAPALRAVYTDYQREVTEALRCEPAPGKGSAADE